MAARLKRGPLDIRQAIEVAVAIADGLAAAHAKGTIHRDIKPSNIFLTSDGLAKILDFGIAHVEPQAVKGMDETATQATEYGVLIGTAGYMSPEQIRGEPAGQVSDIFSLGCVLYEMLVGRRAFDGKTGPEMMASVLTAEPPPLGPGAPAGLELLVARCLKKEPEDRPASARDAASELRRILLGVVARNETPSPELVAAAGEGVRTSVKTAVICLIIVIALLPVAALVGALTSYHDSNELPGDVLIDRARGLAAELGYRDAPRDWAAGTDIEPRPRARGEARAVLFWYRQSPEPLIASILLFGKVSQVDPPLTRPGEYEAVLDSHGRLVEFSGVPGGRDATSPAGAAPDWSRMFAAAGLSLDDFRSAAPPVAPALLADSQTGWVPRSPDPANALIRVEAATWHGQVTLFRFVYPWQSQPWEVNLLLQILIPLTFLVTFGFAIRAYRTGRGDPIGAGRIAVAAGALTLTARLLVGHYTGTAADWVLCNDWLSWALWIAVLNWTLYMTVEPFARKMYPEALISWTRLLRGRFGDPLVGRDVLFGMLVAGAAYLTNEATVWLQEHLNGQLPERAWLDAGGARFLFADLANMSDWSLLMGLFFFAVFVLIWAIVRRRWIAWALVFLLVHVAFVGIPRWDVQTPMYFLSLYISYVALTRVGFLAYLCAQITVTWLWRVHLLFTQPTWHAPWAYLGIACWLLTAAWGFRAALAGRRLFQNDLLS